MKAWLPTVPVALLVAGAALAQIPAGTPDQPIGSRMQHRVVELARGLAHPWSLAFLPDGRLLISERTGGLRVFDDGALLPRALSGVPSALAKGDGGLLGLALDPQYASNQRIYLCLAAGTEQENATAVVRARLRGAALEDAKEIFRAAPAKAEASHFGCRLLFLPDRTLLVTLGDGYDYKDQAQAMASHLGKIVRITRDGAAPRDNPFPGGARPEIYTLGHRNVQGIALRPGSAEIWTHEHGARGGDEVNVLKAGANFGWPLATFGIDYSGQPIAPLTSRSDFEAPRWYWVPSIAPSGMTFYDGERFPEWRGDVFVGGLAARALYRLDLQGGRIVGQEILLAERKERIREVQAGPDGLIYVLTDAADGKLLRLEPRE